MDVGATNSQMSSVSLQAPGPPEVPNMSTSKTRQNTKRNLSEALQTTSTTERFKFKETKKRRKTSKYLQEASPRDETEAVPSKTRRKSGKLASLPGMPLDILFEIFRHLMPHDVLKLARTTKDFRNLLLSRSSISVWKDSLGNVPGLPECPPEMSLPAWVNLVFSPQCHYCAAYTRTTEWLFRVRICKRCATERLGDIKKQLLKPYASGRQLYLFRDLVPIRRGKRGSEIYLVSEFDLVQDEYNALADDARRKVYIKEKQEKIQSIKKHAASCESWARSQIQDRDIELSQLREERKAAIIEKLRDLGWAEDIDGIRYPDSFSNHKLVDRPQRLTERIWFNIKDGLLEFMAQMREKRLKRERDRVVMQRKKIAMQFLQTFRYQRLAEHQIMPEAPDFCSFAPVQDLLNVPSTVEISLLDFDNVVPMLPDLVDAWRQEIHNKFIQAIMRNSAMQDGSDEETGFEILQTYMSQSRMLPPPAHVKPLSEEEVAQKITLAATVFSCVKCRTQTHSLFDILACGITSRHQGPLFYPQVLGHFCFTRRETAAEDYFGHLESDPSRSLGPYSFIERNSYDCSSIIINHPASEFAQRIIESVGLDVATTTSEQMDSLSIRFVCVSCAVGLSVMHSNSNMEILDGIPLLNWRGAVKHQLRKHSDSKIENLTIVNGEQLDDSIKEEEEMLKTRFDCEWGCAHCLGTPEEQELEELTSVKEHLLNKHEIIYPAHNVDFFKHFSEPSDYRALLVRKLRDGRYYPSVNTLGASSPTDSSLSSST